MPSFFVEGTDYTGAVTTSPCQEGAIGRSDLEIRPLKAETEVCSILTTEMFEEGTRGHESTLVQHDG